MEIYKWISSSNFARSDQKINQHKNRNHTMKNQFPHKKQFLKINESIKIIERLNEENVGILALKFNKLTNQNIPTNIIEDFQLFHMTNMEFLYSDYLPNRGFKNLPIFLEENNNLQKQHRFLLENKNTQNTEQDLTFPIIDYDDIHEKHLTFAKENYFAGDVVRHLKYAHIQHEITGNFVCGYGIYDGNFLIFNPCTNKWAVKIK